MYMCKKKEVDVQEKRRVRDLTQVDLEKVIKGTTWFSKY